MSYTTFKLSHGTDSPARQPEIHRTFEVGSGSGWSQIFSVTVQNTGTRAGDEVVQAFMTPPANAPPSSGGLPLLRQMIGFERVSLAPGASRTLYFTVNASKLALAAANGDRVSHPGAFGLLFTNGVDERVETSVKLEGQGPVVVEPFAGRA